MREDTRVLLKNKFRKKWRLSKEVRPRFSVSCQANSNGN
jgi:hypothetical protein